MTWPSASRWVPDKGVDFAGGCVRRLGRAFGSGEFGVQVRLGAWVGDAGRVRVGARLAAQSWESAEAPLQGKGGGGRRRERRRGWRAASSMGVGLGWWAQLAEITSRVLSGAVLIACFWRPSGTRWLALWPGKQ